MVVPPLRGGSGGLGAATSGGATVLAETMTNTVLENGA